MKNVWTDTELALEALKYKSRRDFAKNSKSAYKVASKRGLLDKICSHMDCVYVWWTDDMLRVEALKYKTRAEFREGNHPAYRTAIRRSVLEQICAHMEDAYTYWTDDMIFKEALKYKTRAEFKYGSNSAYILARRRKILDRVCSHMVILGTVSVAELGLMCEISKRYPTAKKIRGSKVTIPDKDYIKRFDLDIYVPELNRGIEFDGTYYHSFEYMRRNKNKGLWTDDDVRRYHEIKDTHFLSIGINIIHITEEEWNADKEGCIKRCLDFLGGSSEYKAA